MSDAGPILDTELSGGQQAPGRRRLVITGVVGIPIVIGVLVSVVFYWTRVAPSLPPPLPSPSAVDRFARDGQVLILEPATSAPVSVVDGQEIEIVLNTGVGQRVSTLDPSVLEAVANPVCRLMAVCGVAGAGAWTFIARTAGTAHLHVIFGTGDCSQRASCPLVLQLLIPITVRPVA